MYVVNVEGQSDVEDGVHVGQVALVAEMDSVVGRILGTNQRPGKKESQEDS